MSNPVKGEVHFDARGQAWTFKLGTNAQVLIESKAGMPMPQFIKRFDNLGASEIRMIFWAGLQRQHPEVTEDDVGDMIDELGADRVADIFKEAFESAVVKKDNGAAPAHPQKPAKARIGMTS